VNAAHRILPSRWALLHGTGHLADGGWNRVLACFGAHGEQEISSGHGSAPRASS